MTETTPDLTTRAFGAGDDLKEFDRPAGTEAATRAYIEAIQDITRAMVLGDKMVVGAIHGRAPGGDLEGAMALETEATLAGFLHPETAAIIARFGQN